MEVDFLKLLSLIICIAGGIQGIILVFALNKVFSKKNVERKWLISFILIVSVTLLGRIMFLYPDTVDARIPVFTDLLLFLFGPTYFFSIKSIFSTVETKNHPFSSIIHFIPAIAYLAIAITLFYPMSLEEYNLKIFNGELRFYTFSVLLGAMIHNITYWIAGFLFIRSIISKYKETKVKLSASYVYLAQYWYLSIILLFGIVIYLFTVNIYYASVSYQLTWMVASWMPYGIGYYVLAYPETFGDILVKFKSKDKSIQRSKQLEKLATKLQIQLEEKHIYRDSGISLIRLAELLETNNVVLSKTINQYFEMGFYDLINKYRVEEFIQLVEDPENSHFTYYALALQAGFNSKTSFNKYFKKIKKQTPKEYFNKLSVA